MALKPEYGSIVGLMSGVLVYSVYRAALPSAADSRSVAAGNPDLASSEKTAEWIAASVAAGMGIITRDPTVFVIGGGTMVGLAWMHRHAVWSPPGGTVAMPSIEQPRGTHTPTTADDATARANPVAEPIIGGGFF